MFAVVNFVFYSCLVTGFFLLPSMSVFRVWITIVHFLLSLEQLLRCLVPRRHCTHTIYLRI